VEVWRGGGGGVGRGREGWWGGGAEEDLGFQMVEGSASNTYDLEESLQQENSCKPMSTKLLIVLDIERGLTRLPQRLVVERLVRAVGQFRELPLWPKSTVGFS